ncbi:hypothetical protein BGZ79_001334 [Entomortierella chlamydospora]|nr:hypothetical protein BGZ79_001334 [Entomortierella chlamydospora]
MAFDIPSDSSLIQAINSSPGATTLSKIAGFVFPIAALVTSIPVNTIVLRYNLIRSGACNKSRANFLAVGLPWLFAIPGMTGSALTTSVGWCSLFFVSATTFVIPYVLFISAKRFKRKMKRLEAAEGEREGRQNKESTMTAFFDDGSLDGTISGSLMGLAFGRKADSGLTQSGCDTSLPSKSKEESNGNASSVMDEFECSGTGMLHHEEKDQQDPEIRCHDLEKMPVHCRADGASPPSQSVSPKTAFGAMSSSIHRRARIQSDQTESIMPPFSSGNNYAIPGFGMCQTRPEPLSRTSSELALHHSKPESDTISPIAETVGGSEKDLESCFSQTHGELTLKSAIQAIPRWAPVPAVVIAWSSLTLTLIDIVATIMYSFLVHSSPCSPLRDI